MGFALPVDTPADTAALLRELEACAPNPTPKNIRAVMIQAATELENHKRLFQDAAQELELAASLRVGQMDSQSRADEVSRQVRMTLQQVAARMRELA